MNARGCLVVASLLSGLTGTALAQAGPPTRPPVSDSTAPRDDPTPDRLVFAATARTLPAGRTYLAGHWMLFPVLAFGVSDRFMITTGGPLLLLPVGPFFVAPKIGVYQSRDLNVATGAFVVAPSLRELNEAAGWVFLTATAGPPNASLTGLVGVNMWDPTGGTYGYRELVQVGFAVRIARNAGLVVEVSALPFADRFVVYAFRFFDRRIGMDVGVLQFPSGVGPYAGAALHW